MKKMLRLGPFQSYLPFSNNEELPCTRKNSFSTNEDIMGILTSNSGKNDTLVALYPATVDLSFLSSSRYTTLLNLCQSMNENCSSTTTMHVLELSY